MLQNYKSAGGWLLLSILATLSFVPAWSQTSTFSNVNIKSDHRARVLKVGPKELNFGTVQIGTSSIMTIKIFNGTDRAVQIKEVASDNLSFEPLRELTSIPPQNEFDLQVKFAPVTNGNFKGTLQMTFDNHGRSKFKVKLFGAGSDLPTITVHPASINTVAPKGTIVRETLTLTNNGSIDRAFNMAVPQTSDSIVYETDFEDYEVGNVDGQYGWTATGSWIISTANADDGTQHLRGTATEAGSLFEAFAPAAYSYGWNTDTEHYSTFSARINIDSASGAAWKIEVRDKSGIHVGDLIINPDRTVDISSAGPYYSSVITRVKSEDIPSEGYFTVVFELIWGDNGVNSWNSMNVYIDETRVFKGYSMGSTIGNVSFKSKAETVGGTLDIDGLRIGLGKYSPEYITMTPLSGIIPAGDSVDVIVSINPASLEFRTYVQNIIAHIDEYDSLIIPVTFDVTGESWLSIQAASQLVINRDRDYHEIYLVNLGGTEIQYEVQSLEGYISAIPSVGIIPKEGTTIVRIGRAVSAPGVYRDTIKITTNVPGFPIYYKPVTIQIDPPEEVDALSVESSSIVSDENLAARSKITLYPNPMHHDSFTLQFAGSEVSNDLVELSIVGPTGRVVYKSVEKTMNGQISISLNGNLGSGVYVVNVRRGHRNYSARLVRL